MADSRAGTHVLGRSRKDTDGRSEDLNPASLRLQAGAIV
jgi:hypothetical protein